MTPLDISGRRTYCRSAFNIIAVKYYGEVEFWLSFGKLLLIIMLFCFTFIVMIGGNPQHDAFGFRYWKNPGSFAEYIATGALGRFQGFLGAFFSAAFTVVGPEYLAMVAGEAERPRTYLKNGFKTMYWRFGTFFIGGALVCNLRHRTFLLHLQPRRQLPLPLHISAVIAAEIGDCLPVEGHMSRHLLTS